MFSFYVIELSVGETTTEDIDVIGPPITKTTRVKGSSVLEAHNLSVDLMAQGPFPIQSPSITVYRQQLWVIAVVHTDNSDGKNT